MLFIGNQLILGGLITLWTIILMHKNIKHAIK